MKRVLVIFMLVAPLPRGEEKRWPCHGRRFLLQAHSLSGLD